MPIEGVLIVPPAPPPVIPPLSYIDRRDTLNRLARIGVTGETAVDWLAVLDVETVREISDHDLTRLTGGNTTATNLWPWPGLYPWTGQYPGSGSVLPPDIVVIPGAWGAGAWGSGPWGG